MKLLSKLLTLFLLTASLPAAITERYVSVAGSGATDGTSAADAMSMATFEDYMATGGSVNAAAGDRFNVLAGTYARTTTSDTWANGGTVTSPVLVRGYTTTIGDGYQGRALSGTGDLVTTNMPSFTRTTSLWTVNATMIIIEGINFSSTRSTTAITVGANEVTFRGCRLTNATSGSGGITVTTSARALFYDCDLSLTNGGNAGTSVASLSGAGTRVMYCRVTSTAVGLSMTNTPQAIVGSAIYGCTGNGINVGGTGASVTIANNTIVGGGADGINVITGNTLIQTITGNMITDNTGDGIDMVSTANAAVLGYNRYRDNASTVANGGDWITATAYAAVTTDTGGPETDYTNAGSNDYRLISASPGKGAAIFPSMSMGAFQVPATAGGQTSSASVK